MDKKLFSLQIWSIEQKCKESLFVWMESLYDNSQMDSEMKEYEKPKFDPSIKYPFFHLKTHNDINLSEWIKVEGGART